MPDLDQIRQFLRDQKLPFLETHSCAFMEFDDWLVALIAAWEEWKEKQCGT